MKKEHLNNLVFILVFISFISLVLYVTYNSQIYGSDPGKVFNRAKIFLDSGYQESFKMLVPPGTIILYSIFLGVFDYNYPLLLIQGISLILLALLIYRFVDYHMHNKSISLISMVLLLSSELILTMAYWLPAYTTALFLATLGIYLFSKYGKEKNRKYLYFSAVFMAMATYFHYLFLFASLIPLITCVLYNRNLFKTGLLNSAMIRFYAIYSILYLPWFLYSFDIARFDFYKAPYTWMQIKYWPEFNLQLLNRPVIGSIDYFQYFVDNLDVLIPFHVILPFIIIGFLKLKSKFRKHLYMSWVFVSIAPVLFGIIPINMRYLLLLVPVLILLTCEGLLYIYNFNKKYVTLVFCIFIIFGAFAINTNLSLHDSRQNKISGDAIQFEIFGDYIGDGENIYFRSHAIQPFFPKNRVYETTELDETDAINFLTWSSDETVINIMLKYNIKWVLLYQPKEEKRLHSWLNLIGQEPTHYLIIENSSYFTKRVQTRNFLLYEFTG